MQFAGISSTVLDETLPMITRDAMAITDLAEMVTMIELHAGQIQIISNFLKTFGHGEDAHRVNFAGAVMMKEAVVIREILDDMIQKSPILNP